MNGTEINTLENMWRKEVSDLVGFRSPNNQECEAIRHYVMQDNEILVENCKFFDEAYLGAMLAFGITFLGFGIVVSLDFIFGGILFVFFLIFLSFYEALKEMQKKLLDYGCLGCALAFGIMFLGFGIVVSVAYIFGGILLMGFLVSLAYFVTAKKVPKEVSRWKEGTFKVLEGTVLSMEKDTDDSEIIINIQFQSVYGEILKDKCEIKTENVTKGSRILLAYVQKNKLSSLKCMAFTPYMIEKYMV